MQSRVLIVMSHYGYLWKHFLLTMNIHSGFNFGELARINLPNVMTYPTYKAIFSNSHNKLTPVISAGWATFISAKIVGAMSASLPSLGWPV
jgi:hypothetical protein